jgi:hypothetical protein
VRQVTTCRTVCQYKGGLGTKARDGRAEGTAGRQPEGPPPQRTLRYARTVSQIASRRTPCVPSPDPAPPGGMTPPFFYLLHVCLSAP